MIAAAAEAAQRGGDPVDLLLGEVRRLLEAWHSSRGSWVDAHYAVAQWNNIEETTNARVEAACAVAPAAFGRALRRCGVEEIVGNLTLQTFSYSGFRELSREYGTPDVLAIDELGQLVTLEFKLGSSYSALQHLRYLNLHSTANEVLNPAPAVAPGVHLVVRPSWVHGPTSARALAAAGGWWHRAAEGKWLEAAVPVDSDPASAVDDVIARCKKGAREEKAAWLRPWLPRLNRQPPRIYELTWWAFRNALAKEAQGELALSLLDRALPVLEHRCPVMDQSR